MARKISKKNSNDFNNRVKVLLEQYGAVPAGSDYFSYQYKIETELGNYYVSIHDQSDSSLYGIFGRFEDSKAASRFTECNPYSGKYNFLCSDKEYCLRMFETFLQRFTYEVTKVAVM